MYRFTRVLKWPTRAKKGPIYTQTRQINYYYIFHKDSNYNLIIFNSLADSFRGIGRYKKLYFNEFVKLLLFVCGLSLLWVNKTMSK
jgi:hypothetical protein